MNGEKQEHIFFLRSLSFHPIQSIQSFNYFICHFGCAICVCECVWIIRLFFFPFIWKILTADNNKNAFNMYTHLKILFTCQVNSAVVFFLSFFFLLSFFSVIWIFFFFKNKIIFVIVNWSLLYSSRTIFFPHVVFGRRVKKKQHAIWFMCVCFKNFLFLSQHICWLSFIFRSYTANLIYLAIFHTALMRLTILLTKCVMQ